MVVERETGEKLRVALSIRDVASLCAVVGGMMAVGFFVVDAKFASHDELSAALAPVAAETKVNAAAIRETDRMTRDNTKDTENVLRILERLERNQEALMRAQGLRPRP